MDQIGDKGFGNTALARRYGELLVPLIFQPYADFVSKRIAELKPQECILETAAGTGVLTRAIDKVLPANVEIVATDINESMMDFGRSESKSTRTSWQQADALQLPFPDQKFDAVVCQFGAMFFPDKQKGFREALRVLKPSGNLVLVMWDDWKAMPDTPMAIAAEIIGKMLDREPASLLNPKYCDERTIRQDLTSAGSENVVIEMVELPTKAFTPSDAAVAAAHGSPLFRGPLEESGSGQLEIATGAIEDELRDKHGLGASSYQLRALVVTARRT